MEAFVANSNVARVCGFCSHWGSTPRIHLAYLLFIFKSPPGSLRFPMFALWRDSFAPLTGDLSSHPGWQQFPPFFFNSSAFSDYCDTFAKSACAALNKTLISGANNLECVNSQCTPERRCESNSVQLFVQQFTHSTMLCTNFSQRFFDVLPSCEEQEHLLVP